MTGGRRVPVADEPCPCGSGSTYGACCGPVHRGEPAATPEALMRSRYCAYAIGDADHVFRTWHPRTRPPSVTIDPDLVWERLEVLDADGDEVEFRAHWRRGGTTGDLHERSRFEQRRDRWVYVDGLVAGQP